MWIKRSDFQRFISERCEAKTRADILDDMLALAKTTISQLEKTVEKLEARAKILEAEILKLQDALYKEKQAIASHTSPVRLDSLFEEDPDLVARDRKRIEADGSSDALLADEIIEEG